MLTLSQNPFSRLPHSFNFLELCHLATSNLKGWVGWETEYLPFYRCDGI